MQMNEWCTVISLTLKALQEDGSEIWKCNLCGAIVRIPAEAAIATPERWYLHKKPVQEVPQVFLDAFRDG
jgi:ribosomal protein L37AE/L43A